MTAVARATRACVLVAVVGALLWAAGATAATRVVGGSVIDIQAAPWQVLLVQERGTRTITLCGGSIIDATRVVTAAHCVFGAGDNLAPVSTLVVRAGISNFVAPNPTDNQQERRVTNVRVHPGYSPSQVGSSDDVAVVYLDAALDLSGPWAKPIALPAPDRLIVSGQAVSLAGFGRQNGGGDADGTLRRMDSALGEPASCGANNAIILCASAPGTAVCSGDSGSALVLDGTMIGITSTGAEQCPAGGPATYTNVAAPEILRFIEGEDNPPVAPRRTSPGGFEYPEAMQVGQSVICDPGGWSGQPTLTYWFRDDRTGVVLQRGALATYKLKLRDLGRRVSCRLAASNAGGTGYAETDAAPTSVHAAPRLTAAPSTVRRGDRARVRVTFAGVMHVRGRTQICVRPSLRVGKLTCTSTRLSGNAARITSMVSLKVDATAPTGTLRAGVAAQLADGRLLTTVAVLRVR
jgi:hypothetical protein